MEKLKRTEGAEGAVGGGAEEDEEDDHVKTGARDATGGGADAEVGPVVITQETPL